MPINLATITVEDVYDTFPVVQGNENGKGRYQTTSAHSPIQITSILRGVINKLKTTVNLETLQITPRAPCYVEGKLRMLVS